MEYKKTIILLALVVFLLSIAGVSASEIDNTIASENANTIELSTDNDIEDNLQTSEENMVFTSTDYDEAIAQTDTEVLGADSATYSDLAEEIGHSGNITLTHKNYTYNGGGTITISEANKVIDGNGAVIDMNGSTIRAFRISASGVTIKNLTIKNANYNGNGGAIYFESTGTVTNCNFINNKATITASMGGAVYFYDEGSVSNCNFINNKATGDNSYGGAIFFVKTGTVTNCNFVDNTANYEGGAIRFIGSGTVTNCNFTGNTADNGGAVRMSSGSVSNCNFTGNTADKGGAVYFSSNGDVTNCNFTGNTAYGNGGAVRMSSGSVSNCNFTNNKATGTDSRGGAVFFNREGTVSNCNFTDNTATYDGGAVFFNSNGEVTNCNFTNNKATGDGGAVYFNDDGEVTNCNFTKNSASSRGGAVYFSDTGNVTNCNFTNNSASDWGGAIYMYSGTVKNCNFTDNTARFGGAVYFSGNGDVTNCNFTDNRVTGDISFGGAIFMYYGNVENCNFVGNVANSTRNGGGAVYFFDEGTVKNCNFTDNKASNSGGAVYFYKNVEGTVINCSFTDNSATKNGGAVYFDEGSNGRTINCNFTDNKATGNGGAVYFNKNSEGNVTNCSFNNNSATKNGGAIYFDEGSNGRTINCNFTDNKASVYGGAVFFVSNGDVTNCNFTNNSASNFGGAIWFTNEGTVENCNFVDNKATYGSGAIYFLNEGTVKKCSFTNNSASGRGGAILFEDTGTVTNCNFTNNSASNRGGAVYFYGNGDVTNCNFTNNSATNEGGAIRFSSTGTVTNCNFTGNNATTGSAIYFYSTSDTKTVSNSRFLNNRANAETLELTKNDNNITIIFTGNDNLLNAIYSNGDVKFTNVAYWGANVIANTGSSPTTPARSNKEAGQNITVSVVVNDILVLNKVITTDENGMIVLDIIAGENYYISARHDTDSYYTEAETINSTMKFNVNVTSQTTNNKTVNITAKSNIPNEIIDGKLLFILPNNIEINATYASNGTWWAVHAFDDYKDYQVNASYIGLDNVTVTNATISISKANSTVEVSDVVLTYGESKELTATTTGATGITAKIDNDSVTVVDNYTIPISGLDAGNYTLTVTTIADDDHNIVNKTVKVTVNPASSGLDVNGTDIFFGNDAVLNYTAVNATGINISIADWRGTALKENVDYNISITDNQIIIRFFDDGTYTVNMTALTDANHIPTSRNVTVHVNPICDLEVLLTAMNLTANYGDTITWNVTIISHGPSSPFNVNLYAYAQEGLIFKNAYSDSNYCYLSIPFTLYPNIPLYVFLNTLVNASNVNLTVNVTVKDEYASDPNPDNNNAGATVEIKYVKADLNITAPSQITAGDSASVDVSLPEDTIGNITVKVDGKEITTVSLINGNATVELSDLNAGNHTVEIAYSGDDKYYPSNETKEITVSKKQTTPEIAVEGSNVDVKLPSDATGNVTLKVDDTVISTVPVTDGTASVKLPKLSAGNHTVEIAYSGDGKYNSSSKTATISIDKDSTSMTADNVTATYNVKKFLTITLTDSSGSPIANATVSVELKSLKIYTTDENGQIKVKVSSLLPKTYTAKIAFNGDDNYIGSNTAAKVVVKKATPKIAAKAKTFKTTTKTKKYTVALKDNKGKPIRKATVYLKVAGKTYKATTNSKGHATFNLKKLTKKGTYKATVTYKANKYYKKATKKVKITVKTAFKTISKGSKNKAIVKKIQRALKNNGYYLSAYGHYLKVDGIYHDCTVKAVKQFQKAKGLKVTGKVDEKTAKKLKII